MDSEHRHELKENDLAQFLSHSKEFWARWGNLILVVILVIAIVILGRNYLQQRSDTARQQELRGLLDQKTPEEYKAYALTVSDPALKARAILMAAQVLEQQVEEIKVKPDAKEADKTRAREDAKRLLTEAVAEYDKVLAMKDIHKVWQMTAHLRKAGALEKLKKFAEAEAEYKSLASVAGEGYPAFKAAADAHLKYIRRVQQPMLMPAGVVGSSIDASVPDLSGLTPPPGIGTDTDSDGADGPLTIPGLDGGEADGGDAGTVDLSLPKMPAVPTVPTPGEGDGEGDAGTGQ